MPIWRAGAKSANGNLEIFCEVGAEQAELPQLRSEIF